MADQACFSFQNQPSCEDYTNPADPSRKLCVWTCPRNSGPNSNDCSCVNIKNSDSPVVVAFSVIGAVLFAVLMYLTVHFCCRRKAQKEEAEKTLMEALAKKSASGDRTAKAEIERKKWYRQHAANNRSRYLRICCRCCRCCCCCSTGKQFFLVTNALTVP